MPQSMAPADFISNLLARIIHECRREAFETEARRGFSQVRPTQAYRQSVEEAEQEKSRRARGSDDVAGIHE
jgi:predicted FMN-binding regulatory protein PaiB